ncbi:MAG: hypothetical protein LBK55_08385 [Azoarcus sp.]|jgi:hypothetical protein|nr:hypothetical protein [Azoarcus sp.]
MPKFHTEIISPFLVKESCEIEFSPEAPSEIQVHSQRFGSLSFKDSDLFSALIQFRLHLEKDGYNLLCNAARRDAYPSRMARNMGGGKVVYLLKYGIQAERKDLVDAFGPTSVDQVCSVEEQRINFENWIRSLK